MHIKFWFVTLLFETVEVQQLRTKTNERKKKTNIDWCHWMALNYETLIRAASKSPEQRTSTEISDVIFPWLKHSLSKKQGLFQKISDGKNQHRSSSSVRQSFGFVHAFRCYSWYLSNDNARTSSAVGRCYSTERSGRNVCLKKWYWPKDLISVLFDLRFYIILQGAVNIYRLDDDHSNPIEIPFDLLTKLPQLDDDPDQRESLIIQTFGNYVVTLCKYWFLVELWNKNAKEKSKLCLFAYS